MIERLPELQINLADEIDRRKEMKIEERCRLSLYWLVNNFCTIVANQENLKKRLSQEAIRDLHKLSEEKLKYYRSSRFGFIIEFFSKLKNLLLHAKLISSGQRGLDATEPLLLNLQKEKEITEETLSCPIRPLSSLPKDESESNQEQISLDSPKENAFINQEKEKKIQHEQETPDTSTPKQIETSKQLPLEENQSIHQEKEKKIQHEQFSVNPSKENQSLTEELNQELSTLQKIYGTFDPILQMLQFETKELTEKTKLLQDSFTILWRGIGKMKPVEWSKIDDNQYKLILKKNINTDFEIPIIQKNVKITIENEIILKFSKSKNGNPVISFPKLNILPAIGTLKSIETTHNPKTKETSYNLLAQIGSGFFSTQYKKSYSHSEVISTLESLDPLESI